MLHATYTSSAQKEQSVDIVVDGTQVLVNLPFILKLINFTVAELKPLTVTAVKDESDQDLIVYGTDITKERRMKVSVVVNRPCVALIEKPGIPDPMILVLEVL